jgi:hypothetical protein
MLTKPEIYANKIYYYKNVIDNPTQLINQIEESDSQLTDSDPISAWNDWIASGSGEPYVFGSIKHTDETKLKRIKTMMEWLLEGKSRNWKYEKNK